jgi:hypothetical protein
VVVVTAKAPAGGKIPESESGFQKAVIDLAHLRGWICHHARPAQTNKGWRTPIQGDAGFPDLVMARGSRVVVAELKSDTGRVSPHQAEWLARLSHALTDVHVWSPKDFEAIKEVLA